MRASATGSPPTEAPPSPPRPAAIISTSPLACPWAHRTIICASCWAWKTRSSMTVVDPIRDERGWAFRDGPRHGARPRDGFHFLIGGLPRHRPGLRRPRHRPRPVGPQDAAASSTTRRTTSAACSKTPSRVRRTRARSLSRPPARRSRTRSTPFLYENVNNGVYRAGFATRQDAYEQGVRELFAALDELDERLATAATSSATSRWRPTGGSSARCCASTPSTSATSSATCGASSTTRSSAALPARPLPAPGHRRDREPRPHQAALLHHPRDDQSDAHRARRPGAGLDGPARPRSPDLSFSAGAQRPR